MTTLEELKEFVKKSNENAKKLNPDYKSTILNVKIITNDNILKQIELLLEKEKEQIIDAFNEGKYNSSDYYIPNIDHKMIIPESEQYYNQTYKSK